LRCQSYRTGRVFPPRTVTVSLWAEADLPGGTGRSGKGERKTFVTRTNIYTSALDGAIPLTDPRPSKQGAAS